MGLVLALVLLALLLGVVGLVVRVLRWLLVLAAVVLVAGLVRGYLARGRTRA